MPSCPIPDCREPMPHEHRQYQYTIETDTHWREVTAYEAALLNEWRYEQGLPRLVFMSGGIAASGGQSLSAATLELETTWLLETLQYRCVEYSLTPADALRILRRAFMRFAHQMDRRGGAPEPTLIDASIT